MDLDSQMPPKGKSQARSQHSKQLMAQKTAAGRHPSHFREGVTKQPTPLPNVRDLQQQLSEKQQQHASELFQLEQQNAELQACADELEAEGQQLWELYMNTEATVRALCNQPWETMEVSLKELSAFRAEECKRRQEQRQQEQQPNSFAPSSSYARAINAELRLQSRQQLPIALPEEDLMQAYKAAAADTKEARRAKDDDKAQKNDQLAAAQKAMGHSTKPKVEDLRAYCQAKRIPYASSASKLVMCKAILAHDQQQQQPQQQEPPQQLQHQPQQQKRRGRPPKQQQSEQQLLTPRKGAKKKQSRA